jgi:hypothetical protein
MFFGRSLPSGESMIARARQKELLAEADRVGGTGHVKTLYSAS